MKLNQLLSLIEGPWGASETSRAWRRAHLVTTSCADFYAAIPHPTWLHWLATRAWPERAAIVHEIAYKTARRAPRREYVKVYCEMFRKELPWAEIEAHLES